MALGDRDYYRPSGFGGFSFFPPVIKNLLIINGIVFFFQMLIEKVNFAGIPGWYFINRYFALNPLFGFDQFGETYNFQIWQILTYQFLHADFSHIFFNMLMLWMFGMEIENLWGSKKFLVFYLTAGIVGGLFQLILPAVLGGSYAPTIGASGSVFGVMVAFAMFFPDRYIFVYFLLPVKAKYLIAFTIIIEFMMIGESSLVAHLVHLGGALSGFLFVVFDRKIKIDFDNIFKHKRENPFSDFSRQNKYPFRKPFSGFEEKIKEAEFYDLNNHSEDEEIPQEVIDRILDKISQSGYQNLTENEKRILFEASKRK
jgi:membrane associated rhomboid family serine protease